MLRLWPAEEAAQRPEPCIRLHDAPLAYGTTETDIVAITRLAKRTFPSAIFIGAKNEYVLTQRYPPT